MVTPDGSARQVADGLWFPNGMAVTADDSTLIVAESYRSRLTAFDIDDDGGLSNRRVWADLGKDAPDGICLDAEGAVWYADVPNRHCVRVARAARNCKPSPSTGAVSPAPSVALKAAHLFIVATKWNGPEKMFQGERTGQVVAIDVSVPHAGLTL